MKLRLTALVLALVLILSLSACGSKSSPAESSPLPWQEQYDLGVRYLSEGNYEEAIIAFTAAIEIDPKQSTAYLSLAEVYTAQGDVEQAIATLQQAQEAGCTDGALEIMLEELARVQKDLAAEKWWAEMQANFPVPPMELPIVRSETYEGGIRYYDAKDRNIRWTSQHDAGNGRTATQETSLYYNSDDTLAYLTRKCNWNDNGQCYSYSMTAYDGTALERPLYEQKYSPTYVTTKTYSYSGSQVDITFTLQFYDTEEPCVWQYTYVMSDPNHVVEIGSWGGTSDNQIGSVGVTETRVTIGTHGNKGSHDLKDTKYDAAGNVLEVKDLFN